MIRLDRNFGMLSFNVRQEVFPNTGGREACLMGRLIATIKYGSVKIRLFLLTVLLLITGGTALAAYGGISYRLWALAAGALLLIIGLVMLLWANFTTEEIDRDDKEEDEDTEPSANRGHRNRIIKTEFGDDVADTQDPKGDRGRFRRDNTAGQTEGISEEDDSVQRKQRIGTAKNDSPAAADKNAAADGKNGKNAVEREIRNTPENNNEQVGKYTPVVLRKMIHRYKVKRDYIPIIIDDSQKFDTARTPALCWVRRKNVYFLLMEGNERVETMPLALFGHVTYKRDVKENNIAAYSRIKDDMGVYERFEEVMPTFNSPQNRLGISSYTKNQYILGGTVAVTPRSMRALRSKYKFDMKLFDSLGIEGEHSIYFKRAYEARVLWTDQVIGQQEYQNMIGAILQQMVDDREIGRYDFLDDLEKMIENRLITSEYADYYMQLRQKRDREARKK